mgnify:CR=1 FL=1
MIKNFLVSIVIPTYNNQDIIERLLISIKNQSCPNIETIVVDDGSKDLTADISRKYTSKVFVRKHSERSVQRNFGASKSKGTFLLFLDSDMELTKRVVADCVRKMKNSKNIGGIVIPEKSVAINYWEKVKAFERSFYNEKGDDSTDAARFFRREAFEKVGSYDETITGPEDWDLPESIKKHGYEIVRIKSKILHHERILNLPPLIKKKYYYALKSHVYLKKQNISAFSPKTIYFLRPVFYKNWRKFLSNPLLSIGMFIMLTLELFGGGLGFLVGKFTNK